MKKVRFYWKLKAYEEKDIFMSYDKYDVKMGVDYGIDKGKYYELYICGDFLFLKFYLEKLN